MQGRPQLPACSAGPNGLARNIHAGAIIVVSAWDREAEKIAIFGSPTMSKAFGLGSCRPDLALA